MPKISFCIKKIPVSLRKLKISTRYVRYIGINRFLNANKSNFNKSLKYIHSLIKSSFSYINTSGFKFHKCEIFCNKSFTIKRYNERAKGKADIIRRRYSNIFLYIYI
ncbi:hypothetical protein JSR06_00685 [Candidatus Vidania fulgoroideae]|uniref:50S ribosomal protein L22 n=1 Tax=Candidatus Vidania fulgoroideorum TaxID=881286 RepID=A0A974X7N1_9PROT|nr:hypothetical protein JSR06_00685 [Candidatus Vidania fulgoroideae]